VAVLSSSATLAVIHHFVITNRCSLCSSHSVVKTVALDQESRQCSRVATRYGLDGKAIEFRWVRDFPRPSTPAVGFIQRPIQLVQGLFPGVKEAGTWH
jgi:hypothetical protein